MSTTLERVKILYQRLHANYSNQRSNDMYCRWLDFIALNQEKIERVYGDDGNPDVFAFRGQNEVPVCGYRWVHPTLVRTSESSHVVSHRVNTNRNFPGEMPKEKFMPPMDLETVCIERCDGWKAVNWSRARAVLIFCHGVTETCRFSLLRLKNLEAKIDMQAPIDLTEEQVADLVDLSRTEGGCVEGFDKSWAQTLVDHRYVVYALDLQGHGLSQAWLNSRCNVEEFNHFQWDVLTMIEVFQKEQEWPTLTALFISGLSMGAMIAIRLCEVAFRYKRFDVWNPNIGGLEASDRRACPRIAGVLLLCPAIGAEHLKSKIMNRILLKFSGVINTLAPTARIGSLARNTQFPYLANVIEMDPLVHTKRVPARLSFEAVSTMDKIIPDMNALPQTLRVCLIQSKNDTMTDPKESRKFLEKLDCTYKESHFIEHSWHFLTKEPGHGHVLDLALNFCEQCLKLL